MPHEPVCEPENNENSLSLHRLRGIQWVPTPTGGGNYYPLHFLPSSVFQFSFWSVFETYAWYHKCLASSALCCKVSEPFLPCPFMSLPPIVWPVGRGIDNKLEANAVSNLWSLPQGCKQGTEHPHIRFCAASEVRTCHVYHTEDLQAQAPRTS